MPVLTVLFTAVHASINIVVIHSEGLAMSEMSRRDAIRYTVGVAAALAGGKALHGEAAEAGQAGSGGKPVPERFAFLHSYESTGRYWRGLEKAGLIRPGVGVRLVNSPFGTDDARRFNTVARVGGDLHRIISERRCPFVIDRVAGGAPYLDYPFDQKLIESYAKLLGPKFLGGQVHESICNTHNDWGRFTKADQKFAGEPVRADELRSYFSWDNATKWLEYGTLNDYAGRTHPRNQEEWWKAIQWSAQRQGARFANHWTYAEGSAHGQLTWHILYKFGAAYAMAEVGVWASSQSQFAIASLRGAAKAAGKPWGVFFAPWGPGGCTSFIPDADWSWQCPRKHLDDSGWPVGPHLGASSALQRRIFFHAYMAGARVLYEEWGAECNLTDWNAGKLSSYGRVTRDFLDFVERCPDVGEPYTPLALIIDASVPPPDPKLWDAVRTGLFEYSPEDAALAKRPGSGEAETVCYGPCRVPEVFDIVPSDAPAEVLARYKQRIYVGPSTTAPAGAEKFADDQLLEAIVGAAEKLSPFSRRTRMPMQINRRAADGAWIVAIYNPWGAKRGDVENVGSVFDEGCTLRDRLEPRSTIKSARVLHAWPASSTAVLKDSAVEVVVGPGGTLVLEVLPS